MDNCSFSLIGETFSGMSRGLSIYIGRFITTHNVSRHPSTLASDNDAFIDMCSDGSGIFSIHPPSLHTTLAGDFAI